MKKGLNQPEHEAQVALFQWAAYVPDLKTMFAVPNGGKRNIGVAIKLAKEGVKAGVPDIMLPLPRCGYHGLFIEMKIKPNTLSRKQKEWHRMLNANGYLVLTAWSFEEAKKLLEDYIMDGPEMTNYF